MEGISVVQLSLYKATSYASSPSGAMPGACTWTFATKSFGSGEPANGWALTQPAISASNTHIWKTTTVGKNDPANGTITTASIAANDWSTAPVLVAKYVIDGAVGAGSKAVKLTANQYAIPFTKAGTESTALTFTATPQNLVGTGTYKFEDVTDPANIIVRQAASTTATYAMNDAHEPASGAAKVIKVTMYDAGTEVATDSVSIYGVQDGSDALTIIFPNGAHVLPSANNGTVSSYSGSGTDIRIYRGATLLTAATSGTTANTFKVSSVVDSNITVDSPESGSVVNVLGTSDTLRYEDHSNMTADLASITYTITVYDGAGTATTHTKVQSFSKSKMGAVSTEEGPQGDSGPRASNFIIYYSSGAATTPGNPTASLYTFANNTFTSLSSGWSTSAPQAVAGTTTSNYWYATVNANEGLDSEGDGTGNTSGTGGSLTIGTAYIGLGFTGLVTFTALSTSGSTTIHGGSISTGTITANKIVLGGINTNALNHNAGWTNDDAADTAQGRADSAYNLAGGKNKTFYQNDAPTSGMIVGDLWVDSNATDLSAKYYRRITVGASDQWVAINPSTVGGWTLTAGSLYSGTQVTNINQGFASSAGNLGHITINSGGSIHTPFFYSNPGGAGFKGTLTVNDGGTSTTLDLSNTTAFNTYVGGKAPIQSVTVGGSSATISNGVLQLAASTGDSLSDTTVGAGFIVLRTAYTNQSAGSIEFDTGTISNAQKTNAIVLETSASTNRITIYDNLTARVIIGKLS